MNISDTQFSFQNKAHPTKNCQKLCITISHTVKQHIPEGQNPDRPLSAD